MKISKKMEDTNNRQMNEELFSEYLYLSMSAYFEAQNLKGFAHWMRKQADEEREHAMRFYNYLFDRDGTAVFEAMKKPDAKWASPLAAFQAAYKHEQYITDRIHKLHDLAMREGDKATMSMLKWFIDEQVEEEASALEIVQKLKAIGKSVNGLMYLNKALAKRE
ncbi:MAG: ferritin [Candidatus Aenigmatarchaeota archaeon]|nr:MAG: ferritin [Candidatus Aenigmarchaeota archaeon]